MGLNKSVLNKIETKYRLNKGEIKTEEIKESILNKVDFTLFSEDSDSDSLYKYLNLTFHTLTLIFLYYITK